MCKINNDAIHCAINTKMASIFLAGLGIAAAGFAGRAIVLAFRTASKNASSKGLPLFNISPYYRGGFEKKMTRREAALILGISPSSQSNKISEAHKRVMLLNHPDKGGSPYLAAKINEAKDYLESSKTS